MDRRERSGDPLSAMIAFGQGLQAGIWTALPCIIQSFNAAKQTCTAQPALKASVQRQNGEWEWVTMPLLVDCPVFFPSGGGVTLTFPVQPGDECLVIFANRCIDAWWQLGGIQVQAEFRMHDLSDGMALPGFASLPKVIPSISGSSAQLRDSAGTTMVEVTTAGSVNIKATGSVSIEAPNITITGNTTIESKDFMNHVHTLGVGTTGGVV